LYGSPISDQMGRLGEGPPWVAASRLQAQAHAYRRADRRVLPAFELVTTVATAHPGPDGTHTMRLSEGTISMYLSHVRALNGLLILDLQTGRSSFAEEIRRYDEFLRLPDVGVALDPEWRVGPGEVPGRTIGSVDAAEVNRVVDHLAELVRRFDLPQKLLMIHQFDRSMITDRRAIHRPPEVAVTFDFDGVGSPLAKSVNYAALARGRGGAAVGIKVYYDEDTALMTPWQLLRLEPEPDIVVYQ
jgi:hypothetical protein